MSRNSSKQTRTVQTWLQTTPAGAKMRSMLKKTCHNSECIRSSQLSKEKATCKSELRASSFVLSLVCTTEGCTYLCEHWCPCKIHSSRTLEQGVGRSSVDGWRGMHVVHRPACHIDWLTVDTVYSTAFLLTVQWCSGTLEFLVSFLAQDCIKLLQVF